MGNGFFVRISEVGSQVWDVVRYPAVVGLLWIVYKMSRYIHRDDRAAMKQINDGLVAENTRLKVDLRLMEERRDFYRARAHKFGNEIFDMADQLTEANLELGLLRRRLGLPEGDGPRLESPEKEA